MENNIISRIIKKKIPCIFLSPHYDDAVLSCCEMLSFLSGKTDVTVINVFTKAHAKPYTLSAKQYLKQCGFTDALTLYAHREQEDLRALKKMPLRTLNLGYQDALFRQKENPSFFGKIFAEFSHVYPTYRWHVIGSISPNDYAPKMLYRQLLKLTAKNAYIFAPFGIGGHVDHRIVRLSAEKATTRLIYYSDFPYNINEQQYGQVPKHYSVVPLRPSKKKEALIRKYDSQLPGLFPTHRIPVHMEVYFVPENR
jgi:LmbE family N-acetylglucosaminyl deacetylase